MAIDYVILSECARMARRKVSLQKKANGEKSVLQNLLGACPDCGSPRIICSYLTGETFCKKCGLVIF